jgi:predicted AAA+ superfamily ATPase
MTISVLSISNDTERIITKTLINWASKSNRKPLVINGARQIGKSWVVKQLGKSYFKGNFLEINFEKSPNLASIFELDLNIKRIIQEIEIHFNTEISDTTLLFLMKLRIVQKQSWHCVIFMKICHKCL